MIQDACPSNSSDADLIPSAKQPCIECPFRTTNADIPAPQHWYTQDNFERIWASVARENQSFPCHMFDKPEATGYDSRSRDMGLRQPVDLGKPKECAGMTGMIHREVRIAAGYPDWETYIAARPTGLQREAYETALARIAGTGIPLTEPANPDNPTLMDPAVRIDPKSMAWSLGDSGINALLRAVQEQMDVMGLPPLVCDCPMCKNHTTVHAPKELTTATGDVVQVDAGLHPLLTAMKDAGIRTTASCQDFHEAMQALWPEQIPVLLADSSHGVSYTAPLRRREAVIRFENRNDAERALVRALRRLDDIHLSDGATETQVSFRPDLTPALTDVVKGLTA